jgi:hypothetical protein
LKPISPKPFCQIYILLKGHFTEGTFHQRDVSPNPFRQIVCFAKIRFTEVHFAEIISPNDHFIKRPFHRMAILPKSTVISPEMVAINIFIKIIFYLFNNNYLK